MRSPPHHLKSEKKITVIKHIQTKLFTCFARAGYLFKPQLIGKHRAHLYSASLYTQVHLKDKIEKDN